MSFALGTIFTKLEAETGSFLKGFAGAAKTIEKFSRDVKKAANEVAQVGTALTALGAGALALASTVDGPTKKAMDGMKAATTGLAVEVARTLLPAVESVTASIRSLADWFAGLSPGTKQMISDFAIFAAQAALVGTALSKVAGLAAGISGAVASLAKAIAGVGIGPILGIALAVGAVIATVLVLHKAWRENWGGIQKHAQAFLQWLQDTWADVFGGLGQWADKLALRVLDAFDSIASAAQSMFEGLGWDGLASAAKSAKEMFRTLREDVQSKGLGGVVKSIVKDMAETGKVAGLALKKELEIVLKNFGFDDFLKSTGKSHSGVKAAPAPDFSAAGAGAGESAGVVGAFAAGAAGAKKAATGFWKGMGTAGEKAIEAVGDITRDLWGDWVRKWKEVGNRTMAEVTAALQIGVGTITNAMGDAGQVIQSALKGFQTGGIWGAIIAIIAEILVRLESFKAVLAEIDAMFKQSVSNINEGLKGLFNGLGKIFSFITQLMNAIEGVINAIVIPIANAIGGVLSMLAKVLQPIVGVFNSLAAVVGPIVKLLVSLVSALTPLAPIFEMIGAVMKVVGIVITTVMIGVGYVVNGILEALWHIFAGLGWNELAKGVSELGRIDVAGLTQSLEKQVADVFGANKGGVGPMVDAAHGAADSLNKLSGAADPAKDFMSNLSNVPSWYKTNEARYNAADPAGGGGGGGGLMNPQGRTTIINIQSVNVSGADPKTFVQQLEKESYRQTGSRVLTAPTS